MPQQLDDRSRQMGAVEPGDPGSPLSAWFSDSSSGPNKMPSRLQPKAINQGRNTQEGPLGRPKALLVDRVGVLRGSGPGERPPCRPQHHAGAAVWGSFIP